MLPSWIRSRNCRPRLVYFFAIEITRRRLASTISFFARRALASPIDIWRLISLMSATLSPVSRSSAISFRCARSISGRSLPSAEECLRLARICFSIQSVLVSFCGKLARKSFFGIPAWRTASAMIWRSWLRMWDTVPRRLLDSSLEHLRESFSCMNSAVSCARALRVFGSLGPSFASSALICFVQPADLLHAARHLGRVGPGVGRLRGRIVVVIVVVGVARLGLGLGLRLVVGPVARLRDLVALVRIDEAPR
jgi:hypothetical protein